MQIKMCPEKICDTCTFIIWNQLIDLKGDKKNCLIKRDASFQLINKIINLSSKKCWCNLNTSLLHKLITINQYMSKVKNVFALGSILQIEFACAKSNPFINCIVVQFASTTRGLRVTLLINVNKTLIYMISAKNRKEALLENLKISLNISNSSNTIKLLMNVFRSRFFIHVHVFSKFDRKWRDCRIKYLRT